MYSTKQANFLLKLASQREVTALGHNAGDRQAAIQALLDKEQPDVRTASDWIDYMKGCPIAEQRTYVTPGVFCTPDGEVYVVKPNRAGDRVYAKRLVETGERVTEADTYVEFDFEYASGAINHITEQDRMPADEAKTLVARYGRCIACGRMLKRAASVEAGIGPVCMKKFA